MCISYFVYILAGDGTSMVCDTCHVAAQGVCGHWAMVGLEWDYSIAVYSIKTCMVYDA